MGTGTDAALAVFVLAAVGGTFVLVDATPSVPWLLTGGVGTLAFELVAAREREAVRRYWERPVVQGGSLVLALGSVAVGAMVGGSSVLSAVLGAIVTYLALLVVSRHGLWRPGAG